MRSALLLITMLTPYSAESVFGIWKVDSTRSTLKGSTQPLALTVRIVPHGKGEVFTLERIEADGRSISSSTILYFDGAPHDFQDSRCSGTQSSRRLDSRTIEIGRTCASGGSSKIVRRLGVATNKLTLEITEQHPDGRTFEQRIVLEKQSVAGNGINRQQR